MSEHVELIVIGFLVATVAVMSWCLIRNAKMNADCLMHFHEAGRSKAQHDLSMARLELEKGQQELERKRMDMVEKSTIERTKRENDNGHRRVTVQRDPLEV